MAETLRELVVALSMDSSNFSRNMRTISQQIKEAESTIRLAGDKTSSLMLKCYPGLLADMDVTGRRRIHAASARAGCYGHRQHLHSCS